MLTRKTRPKERNEFPFQENEALRDRIERILTKVKTFTSRKRQELNQSLDSGYGSVDLGRRSVEMKVRSSSPRDLVYFVLQSFIKDVDLETSHLSEVTELISTLTERRCDQQVIRALERKQDETFRDLQR